VEGAICAPSASRGHADERAFHLLPDALHRAGADAQLARDLAHALAEAQLSLDAFFDGGIDFRPTELLALCDRSLKARVDALTDHAAFKLGEKSRNDLGLIHIRCSESAALSMAPARPRQGKLHSPMRQFPRNPRHPHNPHISLRLQISNKSLPIPHRFPHREIRAISAKEEHKRFGPKVQEHLRAWS
jgi:hypothetical protein